MRVTRLMPLLAGAPALLLSTLVLGGCADSDALPVGRADLASLPEQFNITLDELSDPSGSEPTAAQGVGRPREGHRLPLSHPTDPSPDPGDDKVLKEVRLSPQDGVELQHFGRGALAISGETLIVGAPDDNENGDGAGAAYIFVQQQGKWTEQAKLLANNGQPGDKLGFSVAISGDTAVLGAYLAHEANGSPGAAYLFVREGAEWTERAELTASDAESLALFGHSVAISGSTVVIGAMQASEMAGAVYVFEQSGSTWIEQTKLTASDGSFGDALGISVAISGDTIVAGAASTSCDKGKYCGSAYVFRRSGSVWLEESKLMASVPAPWNFFGRSVSLYGNRAVATTYLHLNADGSRGAAYVFERDGSAWAERTVLTSPDAGSEGQFGVTASVFDSRIVVGAPNSVVDGRRSGAAYVFSQSGSEWAEERKLAASDGMADDSFGYGVASSQNVIAAVAPDSDALGEGSGSAYVFCKESSHWGAH